MHGYGLREQMDVSTSSSQRLGPVALLVSLLPCLPRSLALSLSLSVSLSFCLRMFERIATPIQLAEPPERTWA